MAEYDCWGQIYMSIMDLWSGKSDSNLISNITSNPYQKPDQMVL